MLPLVGLAHGSRDPRASPATEELLAAVAALRPGLRAVPAYLDLAEPDLSAALTALDVPEAVVMPLLFTQAFHADVDTPSAITEASAATGTRIRRAGILGMGPAVLAALQLRAVEAGIADIDGIVLAAVGSSSASANAAVGELAARWAAERTGPVRAAFATAGQPKVRAALEAVAQSLDPPARVGVVPLFAAPGLLLDVIARHAAVFDAPVAEPLGVELAPLILQKYDEVAGGR
ncbi:sirohydrochlorin chelatase [Nakamurella deserti]|uniref:sirohydrochlorin chelatase n=1 Tax=Nakamurella deserti TaxID=2164074 RepID=UPI000DBE6079|nr:CbiX/SirB N-terminal domain-containing protein [Nakamurella deserti]